MTAPSDAVLLDLLDRCAPYAPAPLSPEISVFQGRSLVEVWEAAEKIAGENLPAPFWAYPWAAGCGLARVILDNRDWFDNKRVLDLGCGGGVCSIAAAFTGAKVTSNDVDDWALAVTRLAASKQNLSVNLLLEDLTERIGVVDDFDVVLCSDMAYEKRMAPRYLTLLQRARNRNLHVLVADAGRTYFKSDGMELLQQFELDVPKDLEGVEKRTAKVFVIS